MVPRPLTTNPIPMTHRMIVTFDEPVLKGMVTNQMRPRSVKMGPFQRAVHCWRARRRGDTGSIMFQVCAPGRAPARGPVLRFCESGFVRPSGCRSNFCPLNLPTSTRAIEPVGWPRSTIIADSHANAGAVGEQLCDVPIVEVGEVRAGASQPALQFVSLCREMVSLGDEVIVGCPEPVAVVLDPGAVGLAELAHEILTRCSSMRRIKENNSE